jgi:hypothetical protein
MSKKQHRLRRWAIIQLMYEQQLGTIDPIDGDWHTEEAFVRIYSDRGQEEQWFPTVIKINFTAAPHVPLVLSSTLVLRHSPLPVSSSLHTLLIPSGLSNGNIPRILRRNQAQARHRRRKAFAKAVKNKRPGTYPVHHYPVG